MLPPVLQTLKESPRPLVAWATSRPSERRDSRVWLVSAIIISIVVLATCAWVSNDQRHEAGFDVLDEAAHYDYAVHLAHGHVPRSGDVLSQSTLRMLSCVGGFGVPVQGCAQIHRNPASVPAAGYSYEAVQSPPLGYLPYLLTTQTNGYSQAALDDARWGGFVWSILASWILIWVAWMADLSLLELTGLLVICLLSPIEIHAMATVTNDSAALPAGAIVVATYLLSRRRRKPMVVSGLVVGVLVGFMKGLFIVAPFVVLAAVLFSDVARRYRPARGDIWVRYGCSVAMFGGAVVSYAAWLLIQDVRAAVPPSVVLHAVQGSTVTSHLSITTILDGVQNGLSDLIAYAPAPLYWLWNLAVYGSLAGLLILRGPVGRISQRAAALAIFVGVAALALAFPLLNFIEGHYNFQTPPRYFIPLLPIIGLVVVQAVRRRGLIVLGLVLPALAVIAQLATGQNLNP